MNSFDAAGTRVGIRRPILEDCKEFLSLMQQSAGFHRPWVDAPKTREDFETYVHSREASTDEGFLLCMRQSGTIAGVVNVNAIVRGFFQSAYLGYYIGEPFARQGIMSEGLKLVIGHAFGPMKLHRLEANVQPKNLASIALVRKCGFRKEGFSPRYLQVMGQWRDHERWALLADEHAPVATAE